MNKSQSLFTHIQSPQLDPIYGYNAIFRQDPNPSKINMNVGLYRTYQGKHYDQKVVKSVSLQILNDQSNSNAYIPIGGDPQFCRLSQLLLFGGLQKPETAKTAKFIDTATVQCLGSTGGLRLGAQFISRVLFRCISNEVEKEESKINISLNSQNDNPPHSQNGLLLLPHQTWPNHQTIFKSAGVEIDYYPYLDLQNGSHDIMMQLIQTFHKHKSGKTICMFQPCANNPTGVDPTHEQWQEIGKCMKQLNFIAFFDCTYLGFSSGSFDEDSYVFRLFRKLQVPMIIALSFSKILTLQGQRVGALHIVTYDQLQASKVKQNLEYIIRRTYNCPSKFGGEIAKRVMSTRYNEWIQQIKMMHDSVVKRRQLLYNQLKKCEISAHGVKLNWDFIIKRQSGWMVWTQMTTQECKKMRTEHSIYMWDCGRIALTYIEEGNVKYLVECMKKVIEQMRK